MKNRKFIDLLGEIDFNQVIFVSQRERAKKFHKLSEDYNFPSICIQSKNEVSRKNCWI
jgi:hypothetical protein